MKYFIDTCIWRDFYEAHIDPNGKPLGSYAASLFMKLLKENEVILFSNSIVSELAKEGADIDTFLGLVSCIGKLRFVETNKSQVKEAADIAKERGLPFVDALNAVQSRDHEAILVSQDKHILQNLSDIAKTKSPQQII